MPWPKGKKRSASTRAKIAQANHRRWSDPKYQARLSKSQKQSWEDSEIRRSRVEPRVGQKRTAETRKKMSESRRKRRGGHTDPKLIAKMNAARRGSHNTKEQNEKISKAKKQWHEENPELSQKLITEATKANKYFDNKLERRMAKILDDLSIYYVKQLKVAGLPAPHLHHKWDFGVEGEKILVEVDGCWWHGCLEHSSASRREELRNATRRQRSRDRAAVRAGWRVLRFWEHDLTSDPGGAAAIVAGAVGRAVVARRSA